MLKVRVQGTPEEIEWFRKEIEKHEEMKVSNASDYLSNVGTNRFRRQFFQVNRVWKEH